MEEDQGQRIRFRGRDMDEVEVLGVDPRPIVGEAVQHGLLGRPVKTVTPMVGDSPQIIDRDSPLPTGAFGLDRPPGGEDTGAEIVHFDV